MGIRIKKYYVVVCDICGDSLRNGEGGILCLAAKKEAENHIGLSYWIKKNGKIICENCHNSL